MYTLINGSQKNHLSNSRYFLDYISNYLDDYTTYDLMYSKFEDIINSINLNASDYEVKEIDNVYTD